MLKVTIPGTESFDERTEQFVYTDPVTLELEHSLLSLSKWESIWEKPFIGDDEKTVEETLSYIYCMILTPDIPEEITSRLTNDLITKINTYIDAKMSATWFSEKPQPGQPRKSRETITSELIYYWMGIYKIWKDCETWHLNRLFTLIKVHSAKNEAASGSKKPRSKAEMMAERRKLNEQRRAEHNTKG
jgi:hypothetical protein